MIKALDLGSSPAGIYMIPWWPEEKHPVKITPMHQNSPRLHVRMSRHLQQGNEQC